MVARVKKSFITPRKIPLLDNITKLWLSFTGFILAILIIFTTFLSIKTSGFKDQNIEYQNMQLQAEDKTEFINDEIEFVKKQKSIAEEVYAANTLLKNSITNLFDLVPDKITLTKVSMDKDSLIIKGITPSKDTFVFLLESPLRSIFHRTQTSFYLREDGWYSFVTYNEMIKEDAGYE
jgi:hypothetical protein